MTLKNVMLLKRLDISFLQIIKILSEKLKLENFIKKNLKIFYKEKLQKRSSSENSKNLKKGLNLEIFEIIKKINPEKTKKKINIPVLKEFKPISTKNIKKYIFEFEKILLSHRKKLFDNLKKDLTNLTKEKKINSISIQEKKQKFFSELGENFLKNFSDNQTKELIENYIFEALHKYIFKISDDEEMKNKQIKEKVGILQTYIKPELLGIPKEYINMKVYNTAICELRKINDAKNPKIKLKILNNVLKSLEILFDNFQINAEFLFPLLVYITLFANVDFLLLNINFIYRFIDESEIIGYNGYLLSNFLAVYHFIENINGTSLLKGEISLKYIK